MPLYGTANVHVRLPVPRPRQPISMIAVRAQVRFNSNFHSLRSSYIKYNPPGVLGLVSEARRVRGREGLVHLKCIYGVTILLKTHFVCG